MKKIKKAGCIVLNKKGKKVALVYRDFYKDYSFPKGHIEGKESLIECAIRETAEETKRDVRLLQDTPIYIEKYNTKEEAIEVYYYLAEDTGPSMNTSLDTHPTVWVKIEDVYNKLTYKSSKELWENINDKIMKYI